MKSLYTVALAGLVSANKKNPFWTKSQAMQSINHARQLPSPRRYHLVKHGRIIGHINNPSLSHFAALAHLGYIVRLS